jgi:O-antigen/teichoic acid export membrane protein
LWLFWEVVFALINSWLLRRRVKRDYGWLDIDISEGKALKKKFPEVMKRAKQVFAHNISSFVASQTDNILIYFFASLQWITIFGNYVLITSKLAQFVYMLLNNSNATVGNLIAEGDSQKTYRVFWQFMALRYLMGVTFIFGLARLTEPFITIWVGKEYLLDNATFAMMLIYTFITLTRATVDTYLSGFGLYQDVWASLTEAGLNLVISLIAGFAWGLKGVVFGTMVSMILMVFLWKPYFLFKAGFKRSVWDYWKNMSLYIGGGILMFVLLWYLFDRVFTTPADNYLVWVLYALAQCAAMLIAYGLFLYVTSRGMRELFRVWWKLLMGFFGRKIA